MIRILIIGMRKGVARIFAASLLTFLVLSLAPAPLFAQAPLEPLVLKVGLYDNMPKLWRDENGVAQGLFPDTLNAIAEEEGWKIEYVYGSWDDGLRRLEAGEIDIMPDVAFSDERARTYDFNQETVQVSWGIFYTRKGVDIESLNDLNGKRIAALTSGILYNGPLGLKNIIDTFGIKAEIVEVKEYAEVFELLSRGDADVGVVNQIYGAVNEGGYDVSRTGIIFFPTELRFALTKGAARNPYLIARIDEDLKRMKADSGSAYHRSHADHLGSLTEEVGVIPVWVKYLLIGLLAVIVLGSGYVLVLRAVRRRLREIVAEKTAQIAGEKERFKSLFDNSNDAILLIDASSRKIVECNDSAWKLVGYSSKSDLVGKKPGDFSAPVQLGGKPSEVATEEVMTGALEKGVSRFEWVLKHKGGTDVFTLVTLTPMVWEETKVLHASLHDETEQKSALDKAISFDRLKGRFVSVLTHVTRTPLSRIRWSLEDLISGDFGKLNGKETALVRHALDGNKEILRVMDNMNTTLDIERGKMSLAPRPTSFESLVRSVVDGYEGDPDCRDVNRRIELPAERLPALDIDPDKIRKAVHSLVDNAMRFMSDREQEVVVRIARRKGMVRMSVADKGIGIPKSEQKFIFERFFRASNAPTKYPDGIGLGLHIAKSIVLQHGGAIGFESVEGKGSTFWFELPIGKS